MFEEIVSLENLFAAWKEFRRGKTGKKDVQAFELRLEDEVFVLHEELKNGTYAHGSYVSFYVCDPKRRHIHKPAVRDRLVHHAVFRVIEPLFERGFIFDAWSCRKGKGTHKAIERFQDFAWKLSRNNTRTVWVLKLDIRKFFESVDQEILLQSLSNKIKDARTLDLLRIIIESFPKGIPLGNLTSQLFANVCLNELDRFVKHGLKMGYYLRYGDDFAILHEERNLLATFVPQVGEFLSKSLKLTIHPQKIVLAPYHRGVDFLGFVCFPHYRILRTKTKKRMLQRISADNKASYLGLLEFGRSRGLGARAFGFADMANLCHNMARL